MSRAQRSAEATRLGLDCRGSVRGTEGGRLSRRRHREVFQGSERAVGECEDERGRTICAAADEARGTLPGQRGEGRRGVGVER